MLWDTMNEQCSYFYSDVGCIEILALCVISYTDLLILCYNCVWFPRVERRTSNAQHLILLAELLFLLYSRIRIQSCDATPFPSSKVVHELIQTFRVQRTPSRVNQPEGISDPKERGPGSDLSLICAVG